jgi:hypothetical protein
MGDRDRDRVRCRCRLGGPIVLRRVLFLLGHWSIRVFGFRPVDGDPVDLTPGRGTEIDCRAGD